MLRAINWCEVVLCERESNLGLGRSILTGVTEVLGKYETVIIFEDDLICVPGTYEYLCAALDQYKDDDRVMSVTGWTHPLVTPSDVIDLPYFDGRAECWVWGTWARAWHGMEIKTKVSTFIGTAQILLIWLIQNFVGTSGRCGCYTYTFSKRGYVCVRRGAWWNT